MNLLNAGCGTHYANGWVNTDVWENEDTRPDVKVEPGEPYPFEDNHFDAIFMGHVLEHIEWSKVPQFLEDMSRIAKPGAPMFAIGPDVKKTIELWNAGSEPFWLVQSVLEHQDMKPSDNNGAWWDGATHHWNCHESRVADLLKTLGFDNIEILSDIIPDGNDFIDPKNQEIVWPIVQMARWQFAIRFTNK
jgi:SAM-dependent methyltransferase